MVKSMVLSMSVIVVSLASSIAQAEPLQGEGQPVIPRDLLRSASIKECGRLTYDPQGGSLVINNAAVVDVVDQRLEEQLVGRASRGPFDACLIGNWNGARFSAQGVE